MTMHLVSMNSTVKTLHFPGGTAAAAPPPFWPGKPALCVRHPLTSPHIDVD